MTDEMVLAKAIENVRMWMFLSIFFQVGKGTITYQVLFESEARTQVASRRVRGETEVENAGREGGWGMMIKKWRRRSKGKKRKNAFEG